ncbi:glutamyl-tRNA reductase, partial [Flagellimonas olearia]
RKAMAESELEKALQQLRNGGDAEQVLRRFQHSLVNKWLHSPSVTLRKMAADGRAEALLLARELLLDDDQS